MASTRRNIQWILTVWCASWMDVSCIRCTVVYRAIKTIPFRQGFHLYTGSAAQALLLYHYGIVVEALEAMIKQDLHINLMCTLIWWLIIIKFEVSQLMRYESLKNLKLFCSRGSADFLESYDHVRYHLICLWVSFVTLVVTLLSDAELLLCKDLCLLLMHAYVVSSRIISFLCQWAITFQWSKCIVCAHCFKVMLTVNVQVLEQAFKNETVGLATRQEFITKKNTLKHRLAEEEENKKRLREERLAGAVTSVLLCQYQLCMSED